MNPKISRRHFVHQSLLTTFSLGGLTFFAPPRARAIAPLQRPGSARLLLSMAAYSFRDYFRDSTHKQMSGADAAHRIDMFQFIDYCAEHGCHGTELTSYYFPPTLTDEYLLRIKHHAFLRGIAISGTAVGNTFTVADEARRKREIADLKKWIDRAQIMGAPHIRVFAGSAERGLDKAQAQKLAI